MANRFLNNIKINDSYTLPAADGTVDQIIKTNGAGVLTFIDQGEAEKAKSVTLRVKNSTASAMSKGQVICEAVSASPPSGNLIEVALADNNGTDAMPALGILNEDLDAAGGANDEGDAIMFGKVSGINTSAFSVGDEVFVDDTPGGLTTTKPTGVKYIQKVGVVIRDDNTNGTIEVFGAGRVNDVPTPLYIDHANQRLGIGITSPQTTLHMGVQAANPTRTEEFRLESRGSSGFGGNSVVNLYTGTYGLSGIYFGDNAAYSYQPARVEFIDVGNTLNYDSTQYHNWKVLGSTKMTLKNNFLGIGITNPLAPLHISSTAVDTDFLIACNNTQARMSINNTGSGDPQINFQLSNSSKFTIGVDNSDSDKFKISGSSSLGSGDRIIVDSSGNVGISATIPSQKLHVLGNARVTGAYYDSNNSPGTLGQVLSSTVTGTDWVDASSGGGGSTGTTNTLPIWSDGPNGVLDDSQIIDDLTDINISTNRNFNVLRNFGVNEFNAKIDVGGGLNAGLVALEVRQKAYVRGGMVISPNPTNVQVDNSSLVVGAGNNDIVAGSDHCLTVGSGNQILNDSDRSVSFGNNNETKSSDNSINVGNTNILKYSNNSHVIGQNNQMGDEYTSNTSGFNNSLIIGSDNLLFTDDGSAAPSSGALSFVIGHGNELRHTLQNSFSFGYSISNLGLSSTPHRNNFNIGGDLTAVSQTMTLGYRNDTTLYPATDTANGLGNTKFVVAVGSSTTTNANALLITEGGISGGSGGTVPMIPRVLLPTVTSFSASNDAAADAIGVPEGALYQNQGVVQINRGGGSTTDPLAGNGGTSGVGGSGTLNYVAKFTPNGNAIGNSLIYDNGTSVGINTINPNQKLTIRGNDNYVATEQTNYAWGGTNTIGVRIGTSTAGLLDFRRWDGGVTHGTAVITQVSSDGGWGLDFRVDNKSTNTSATSSRMFLSTSGEVGIGTTSPAAKIHVANGTLRTWAPTSGTTAIFESAASNRSFVTITGTNESELWFGDGNTQAKGRVRYENTNDRMVLWTNGGPRMYINAAGDVGIGTPSPNVRLHVKDSGEALRLEDASPFGSPYMTFYQASTRRSFIQHNDSSNTFIIASEYGPIDLKTASNGAESTRLRVTAVGDVGIDVTLPSYKLDVNGTIRATGDVIAYSDIRVKENIKSINNALDKVKKLRGVEYNKIDNTEKSIGVIAQEIEEVIPEVVREDDQGMKSVAYGNITAVLIEAIKEQQNQIDELKNQLNAFTK